MLTKAELEFYENSTRAFIDLVEETKKIRESVEIIAGRTPTQTDSQETPVKEEYPTDSTFDVLAVTSVQVFPFADNASLGHVKAYASIVLNDQIQIRGLRVMEGVNGLFVGYPTDPFYKGDDFRTVVSPITRQLKEHIENCVLEKYQDAIK